MVLRAHIERAAEDVGKAQHIVDLVGIVGAAGGDDGVGTDRLDIFRRDFGIGIGHGEDDRRLRHRLHHVLGHRAFHGKAEEQVAALQRVGKRARVGVDRMRRFPLVHAVVRPR